MSLPARNFYLTARIDGRREPLRGGPSDLTGGFDLLVTQRDRSRFKPVLRIAGSYEEDSGKLLLGVWEVDEKGGEHLLTEIATRRDKGKEDTWEPQPAA